MRFEDFDKKIKEAADQHYPAYDEKAWKKMQVLLDVHLPREKDDRRRIIFLLLLFFLLIGGILLWVTSPRKTINKPVAVANKSIPSEPNASRLNDASQKNNVSENQERKAVSHENSVGNSISEVNQNLIKKTTNKEIAANAFRKINSDVQPNKLRKTKSKQETYNYASSEERPTDLGIEKKNKTEQASKSKSSNSISEDISKTNTSTNVTDQKNAVTNEDKTTNIAKTDSKEPLISSAPGPENKKQEDKAATSRNQKTLKKSMPLPLGITVSSGVDVSAVGIMYVGKAKLLYGAGLSYGIKRVVLRTGIYFSRKIYSAEPDEYHMPNGWPNYSDLQRVDADCAIIQVPVSVSYLLSESKSHNWFVSTGLTSLLMKRETYNYLFKVSGGPVQSSEWTLNNKNKHYFSVLNLSGGYERKFNERTSLSAEPYIDLPLQGIGFGKVKLMSAGVMFTLTVKPFTMKK